MAQAPAPPAPHPRTTAEIFESVLNHAPDILAELQAARARGIADAQMKILVSFNQLGDLRVEVNADRDGRHQAVLLTYMAPDGLESADVLIDDSNIVGRPGTLLSLRRR